jgi:hypothetical protein
MREQYLDRRIDPEKLSIPLVLFPRLNRVIPQSETDYVGWSAFIDAVAPTPAPVVKKKGLRGIEWAKLGYESARKLCIS